MTGMSFPLQDELLEFSLTEEEISSYQPSIQQQQNQQEQRRETSHADLDRESIEEDFDDGFGQVDKKLKAGANEFEVKPANKNAFRYE